MKIKHKLIIMVGISLAGLLSVGGIGIRSSSTDTGVLREIQDTRIPKIEDLGSLDSTLTDLVRRSYEIISKRGLPFEDQLSELRRIHEPLGKTLETAPELVQRFGSRPIAAVGKPLWDRFVSLWDTWVKADMASYAMLERVLASPSPEAFNALFDQTQAGNLARRDQTTDLRETLDKLVQVNKTLVGDSTTEAIAISDRAMWTQIVIGSVIFIILLGFSWSTIIAIVRPLSRFGNVLDLVANDRDLTQRISYAANDEIGEMATSFDHTMGALQEAFRDIRAQIENVSHSVEALASTAKQVAASSQSQSSSSSAMAASVEEMAVSINTVSSSATDAQSLAQEAGRISDEGGKIVEKTSSEMVLIAQSVGGASGVIQTLGEASKEISNIVQVIREVADQTNLLALNAAIEAARAGEQGRGFAVVADEVRKLAERTAQSTGDISMMIGKIQTSSGEAVQEMDKVVKQVESGQALAQEAGQHIRAIRTETGKVSDAMTEISNALREQGEASNDIAKHVESIAQITDENNAAAEETSSNAQRLDELARNVQSTINRFKV
jgi:methyl-accepting chemotaxis protein